ncbi:unnamed protein product [Citrullus colocynthis]|uniref:Uncharacterized protein n=1 Tax=Citrullus colocynthis TaxID=252529 RepID=A0ABP0Y7W6_9ROSI
MAAMAHLPIAEAMASILLAHLENGELGLILHRTRSSIYTCHRVRIFFLPMHSINFLFSEISRDARAVFPTSSIPQPSMGLTMAVVPYLCCSQQTNASQSQSPSCFQPLVLSERPESRSLYKQSFIALPHTFKILNVQPTASSIELSLCSFPSSYP